MQQTWALKPSPKFLLLLAMLVLCSGPNPAWWQSQSEGSKDGQTGVQPFCKWPGASRGRVQRDPHLGAQRGHILLAHRAVSAGAAFGTHFPVARVNKQYFQMNRQQKKLYFLSFLSPGKHLWHHKPFSSTQYLSEALVECRKWTWRVSCISILTETTFSTWTIKTETSSIWF